MDGVGTAVHIHYLCEFISQFCPMMIECVWPYLTKSLSEHLCLKQTVDLNLKQIFKVDVKNSAKYKI